jgi:hypothetical protein
MWLQKHWLAFLTFILTALYLFLQLLQWKRHGDDFMMMAFGFVITAALWVLLIGVIARYWRDGRQAGALRLERNTAEIQHRADLAELAKTHETVQKLYSDANRLLVDERATENGRFHKTEQSLIGQIAELERAPKVDYESLMMLTERDRKENLFLKSQLSGAEEHREASTRQISELQEEIKKLLLGPREDCR